MTAQRQQSVFVSVAKRLLERRFRVIDNQPQIYRMRRAGIGLSLKATGRGHSSMQPTDLAQYLLRHGFVPEADLELFRYNTRHRFTVDLDAPTLPFSLADDEQDQEGGCPLDTLEAIGVDDDHSQTWVFVGLGEPGDPHLWPPIENEDESHGGPIGIPVLYQEIMRRINQELPEEERLNP